MAQASLELTILAQADLELGIFLDTWITGVHHPFWLLVVFKLITLKLGIPDLGN